MNMLKAQVISRSRGSPCSAVYQYQRQSLNMFKKLFYSTLGFVLYFIEQIILLVGSVKRYLVSIFMNGILTKMLIVRKFMQG